MGFHYYLTRVESLLTDPSKQLTASDGGVSRRYELVRTEHLEDDMRRVRAWADLPPSDEHLPHAFSNYPGHGKTHMSDADVELLRKHLHKD